MPPYENQCNANGNMIAIYDTAKNYNRVLYWDDDNRLTKTVDTQAGVSTATQYAYDAKGMRIIKDGPYGKSIYVDTGYVLSQEYVESNHVFVGNTRIASVVKHKDETKPATYYYASDHLGSSSVLTTSTGGYHERIEYLPYGETWFEDTVNSNGYTTPYKFTGKELDKETGLYYFGARYYDARISRWISTDPALQEGKYFPKPNDYDTEHDFYWYLQQDGSRKLVGLGGVFNAVNTDVYHYAGNNPVKLVDPDGNDVIGFVINTNLTIGMGRKGQIGIILDDKNNIWVFASANTTLGINMSYLGGSVLVSSAKDAETFLNQQYITFEAGIGTLSGEIGVANSDKGFDYLLSFGISMSDNNRFTSIFGNLLSKKAYGNFLDIGFNFNFCANETQTVKKKDISDPKVALKLLNEMKKIINPDSNSKASEMIDRAIKYYQDKLNAK